MKGIPGAEELCPTSWDGGMWAHRPEQVSPWWGWGQAPGGPCAHSVSAALPTRTVSAAENSHERPRRGIVAYSRAGWVGTQECHTGSSKFYSHGQHWSRIDNDHSSPTEEKLWGTRSFSAPGPEGLHQILLTPAETRKHSLKDSTSCPHHPVCSASCSLPQDAQSKGKGAGLQPSPAA